MQELAYCSHAHRFANSLRQASTILTFGLLIFVNRGKSAESAQLEAWPVDPLIKVFSDDSAPISADHSALAEVARGETASIQVAVRSASTVHDLRATLSPIKSGNGNNLDCRSMRFVGYVPVKQPIQVPPRDVLRPTPDLFPDPLLEMESVELKPRKAQAIWLTIPIANDTIPGTYQGSLTLSGRDGDQQVSKTLTVEVRVFAVCVRPQKLWVTNWFVMDTPYKPFAHSPESPEYWRLMRAYAKNMAEHRQNVVLIDPLCLARIEADAHGKLKFDFSQFDKWVAIFEAAGALGLIEGGHLGNRFGDHNFRAPFGVRIWRASERKVSTTLAEPNSQEAHDFYSQYLPALINHLSQQGQLHRYIQHLADEPLAQNQASYRDIAALVRKYAPKLRIVEATHSKDLTGSIDIWVPMLNYFHKDFRHYSRQKEQGDEVWFYTCWKPQAEYANRFVEQPLLKTRLLHWINFRYGATGYLHWGYNQWTADDPFLQTTVHHNPTNASQYLPAGDSWIVYPGKEGPLDSIRHEAMRDGIADYELLCQLSEIDPVAANNLVREHILNFDRYDCDVAKFRQSRRQLLTRLSQ